jgi:hypothetical protein
VNLRIEEQLDVDDALFVCSLEVGARQDLEIPRVAQHVGRGVVDVEKRLQARELISLPQLLDTGVGQHDAVLPGQWKGQLRLQRALDVQVQFRLGQAANERSHAAVHVADSIRIARRIPPGAGDAAMATRHRCPRSTPKLNRSAP